MKTTIKITTLLAALVLTFNLSAQNVGINATGATPDASALLDLSSADKGFLITRVDTASIPSPAFGLMTLAPSDSCLYMFNGTTWTSLGGIGTNCSISGFTPPVLPVFPCGGTVIPIVDVTNPTTGKTWMDRNLGASRVATDSTDTAAYGDYYQWGRCSDGHEKRTSGTTTTQSTTDTPANSDFIITITAPYFFDWRNPKNDNLWQGVAGINNPCPTGYRIPTKAELDAEHQSWGSQDAAGAFASPLKLPLAGYRSLDGSFAYVGSNGHGSYWSSTVNGSNSEYLFFSSGTYAGAYTIDNFRLYGYSVRCIKD